LAAKKDGGFLNGYFEHSRRPIYSIVASAPFFIAYELGIIFLYPHQPKEGRVKNLAEVILHQSARLVGKHAAYILPVLAGMILLYLLHRRDQAERKGKPAKPGKSGGSKLLRWGGFRFDYLLFIFVEGLVLALPLGLLIREIPNVMRLLNLGASPTGRFLFRLTTMCGAGAYEELLFRLFMYTAFFYMGNKLLRLEKLPAGILAAAVSGVLFALFHFVGAGREFDTVFFVFATIAGIYLAAICHFRSFGVAVAAHAIYDIFVVLTDG
jgi:Type II CAAX prenyl endopeptidase Rce1-like